MCSAREYNIQKQSTLHLALRLCGGSPPVLPKGTSIDRYIPGKINKKIAGKIDKETAEFKEKAREIYDEEAPECANEIQNQIQSEKMEDDDGIPPIGIPPKLGVAAIIRICVAVPVLVPVLGPCLALYYAYARYWFLYRHTDNRKMEEVKQTIADALTANTATSQALLVGVVAYLGMGISIASVTPDVTETSEPYTGDYTLDDPLVAAFVNPVCVEASGSFDSVMPFLERFLDSITLQTSAGSMWSNVANVSAVVLQGLFSSPPTQRSTFRLIMPLVSSKQIMLLQLGGVPDYQASDFDKFFFGLWVLVVLVQARTTTTLRYSAPRS